FTYDPQFKLWIGGNHKPSFRGVDVAIRERFKLLPFTVSFADNPDRELEGKLRAEGAGILRWAVRGCLEYQAGGLGTPAAGRDPRAMGQLRALGATAQRARRHAARLFGRARQS